MLRTAASGHVVACHFFEEIEQKEGHEVAVAGSR
jgi:hypothetical protein